MATPTRRSCWVCLQPLDEARDTCNVCGKSTEVVCANHGGKVKLHHENVKIRDQVRGKIPNPKFPEFLRCGQCGFDQLIARSHLEVAEEVAVRLLKQGKREEADTLAKEIRQERKKKTPKYDQAQKEAEILTILLEKIPPLEVARKYSEMVKLYEKVLKANPTHTGAVQGIRQTRNKWCKAILDVIPKYLQKKDFEGARDLINAAQRTGSDLGSEIKQYLIKIKNDEIKTYISLAQKHEQSRDFNSARTYYEAAVKAAPTNATVSEHLTRFNQRMEKKDSLESDFNTNRDKFCLNECKRLLNELKEHDPGNPLLEERAGLETKIDECNKVLSQFRQIIDSQANERESVTLEGEVYLIKLWNGNSNILKRYDDPYCETVIERIRLAHGRNSWLEKINEAIEEDRILIGIWADCAQVMDRFEPGRAIKPKIRDAQTRVSAADSIIDASSRGDEEKIVQLWNQCSEHHGSKIFSEEYVGGLPLAERVKCAERIVVVVGEIMAVITDQEARVNNGSLKTWQNELSIETKYGEHTDLLKDNPYSREKLGDRVLLAKKLREAFKQLKKICAEERDKEVLQIWKECGERLNQYESVESLKPNIADAATRVRTVDDMTAASADGLEEKIIQLWEGCMLLKDSVIAATEEIEGRTIIARYSAALNRVKGVNEMSLIINKQDALSRNGKPITLNNEKEISEKFDEHHDFFVNSIYFEQKLGNRFKQAKYIYECYKDLSKACDEDNWPEINRIWTNNPQLHNLAEVQGDVRQDLDDRAKAIRALELFIKVYVANPHDDEKLLLTWDKVKEKILKLGDSPHPRLNNKSPKEIISNYDKRNKIYRYISQEITKSHEDRDYIKISEKWDHEICEAHPRFSDKLTVIQAAVKKAQWIAYLINAVKTGKEIKVVKTWEKCKDWMGNLNNLIPYYPQIEKAVLEAAGSHSGQIYKDEQHRSGLDQDYAGFKVNWEWPKDGPEDCLIAVKDGKPPDKPVHPHEKLPAQQNKLINRKMFHASNGCHFESEFIYPHVSVWPVVLFRDKKIILEKNGSPFLTFNQATIRYHVESAFLGLTKKVLVIESLSGSFKTPHLLLFGQLHKIQDKLTELCDLGEIDFQEGMPYRKEFDPGREVYQYFLKCENTTDIRDLNIEG